MALEMRKRPIITGKNASKFLAQAEENKKLMEMKKARAIKKWKEQIHETKD